MTTFTFEIPDSCINTGVEYSKEQILQGIRKSRFQHNQNTGESLSDAEWMGYTLAQIGSNAFNFYKSIPLVSPSEIGYTLDWDGLVASAFSGVLHPLFQRLTSEAQSSSSRDLAIARGDIVTCITSVRNEQPLASAILMAIKAGFVFTDAEEECWNNELERLYFSDTVKIRKGMLEQLN